MPGKTVIQCPSCGKRFHVSDDLKGKRARCPCGNIMTVVDPPSGEEVARKWYYARDGERYGPLAAGELTKLLESGRVGAADFVWTRGMGTWKAASDVKQFADVLAAKGQHPEYELAAAADEQQNPEPGATADIGRELEARAAEREQTAPAVGQTETQPVAAPEAESRDSALTPAPPPAESLTGAPAAQPSAPLPPAGAPERNEGVAAPPRQPSLPPPSPAAHAGWMRFLKRCLQVLSFALPACALVVAVWPELSGLLGGAPAPAPRGTSASLPVRVALGLTAAGVLFLAFQGIVRCLDVLVSMAERMRRLEERLAALDKERR